MPVDRGSAQPGRVPRSTLPLALQTLSYDAAALRFTRLANTVEDGVLRVEIGL